MNGRDAAMAPQASKVPPTFRLALRDHIDSKGLGMFDDLCAWEDEIVEALNIASAAADRMADALEAIEETSYGPFATTGAYAAFIRDLARNGRFPK